MNFEKILKEAYRLKFGRHKEEKWDRQVYLNGVCFAINRLATEAEKLALKERGYSLEE